MNFNYKNASKKELKIEYKRVARKIGDIQFFTKRELNYLPEILTYDEEVIAFTSGIMDANSWLIVLTDKKIIFLDKGMIYGLKQIIINLDKINSVSGKIGLFFGEIFIEDRAKERYINNVWKKTVKPFINLLMESIERYKIKLNNTKIEEDSYIKLKKTYDIKK